MTTVDMADLCTGEEDGDTTCIQYRRSKHLKYATLYVHMQGKPNRGIDVCKRRCEMCPPGAGFLLDILIQLATVTRGTA
jgi:hypothetical protein